MLLLLGGAKTLPQPEPIVLQNEKLAFTPKEFYIADVWDERDERRAVAWLLSTDAASNKKSTILVDLQGGAHSAIKQFAQQSLSRNTSLRPIIVRLHECRVTEEPAEDGSIKGRISVVMSFDFLRDNEYVYLTDYEGAVRYSRAPDRVTVVEPALRKALGNALKFLNNWMDAEALKNEKLARGVKVFFRDYAPNPATDTVFYALDRPLQWADFQGKPLAGKYAASVFPSFAYGGPSEVVNGYIHLNLHMKVYMLKENSWVKAGAANAYALNHEQRHFDLVKLVTERFKLRIQGMALPVADYGGIIAYEYIESFREMNRLQDQYDGETRHGLDTQAQERWNQKIDADLKSFGLLP